MNKRAVVQRQAARLDEGSYDYRIQQPDAVTSRSVIDTPEFRRWFAGSKVVDADGNPQVVYHGTMADFSEFSHDHAYSGAGSSTTGSGFYFTTDRDAASGYAGSGYVIPAYLSIKNPIEIDFRSGEVAGAGITLTREQVRSIILAAPGIHDPDGPLSNYDDVRGAGFSRVLAQAIDINADSGNLAALRNDFFGGNIGAWLRALTKVTGRDGAYSVLDDGTVNWVAWSPTQIKSAIGNRGSFDPVNPRFTESNDIVVHSPVPGTFCATVDGGEVGRLNVDDSNDHVTSVSVHPDWRRRGIATMLYNAAEAYAGHRMRAGTAVTPNGAAFRAARYGAESSATVGEFDGDVLPLRLLTRANIGDEIQWLDGERAMCAVISGLSPSGTFELSDRDGNSVPVPASGTKALVKLSTEASLVAFSPEHELTDNPSNDMVDMMNATSSELPNIHSGGPDGVIGEEEICAEATPPGMEQWVKDRKAGFKKQYGKDWEERLYATAWSEYGKQHHKGEAAGARPRFPAAAHTGRALSWQEGGLDIAVSTIRDGHQLYITYDAKPSGSDKVEWSRMLPIPASNLDGEWNVVLDRMIGELLRDHTRTEAKLPDGSDLGRMVTQVHAPKLHGCSARIYDNRDWDEYVVVPYEDDQIVPDADEHFDYSAVDRASKRQAYADAHAAAMRHCGITPGHPGAAGGPTAENQGDTLVGPPPVQKDGTGRNLQDDNDYVSQLSHGEAKIEGLGDADSPEAFIAALRDEAQDASSAASNIASAWQDDRAGKFWAEASSGLEALADKLEKWVAKNLYGKTR